MADKFGKFGIIVSGGPAPGINAVIASVVFTATSAGYKVKGFTRSTRGICEDGVSSACDLLPPDVVPVQNDGGSILSTSRFNPFENEEKTKKFFGVLDECGVDKLVMIGGEGTAFLSLQISRLRPDIKVIHVPKTIDNDLILPNQYPCFGFETARYVGSQLISTLITEAKTTNRWFVVKTMGRNSGFLALGLGIASGAAVTAIPEQLSNNASTDDILNLIMPSILKRLKSGQAYGVVILAEGLIDKLDPAKTVGLESAPRDAIGRLMFSEVNLEDLIVEALEKRSEAENLNVRFKPENIGYVLRCAPPISFDLEYTKFLGYGAVKYLLSGKTAAMVVRNYDRLDTVNLEDMTDDNDRIASRCVDLNSDFYKVACNFMIK